MIKWVRAKLYTGKKKIKSVGHMFECGEDIICFQRFAEGDYPPFDCLNLNIEDAIQLRDWLDKILVFNMEITND
jgi:hypothetical protein